MATSTYLLSTALMGVLILGVAFVVARGRAWHQYRPEFFRREEDASPWDDPALLVLGFVLLFGASLGVTLVAVGGGGVTLFLGVVGALVVGFLAVGIYSTARSNGHPHSHAVAESIAAISALVLVAIVVWLLTTAGA